MFPPRTNVTLARSRLDEAGKDGLRCSTGVRQKAGSGIVFSPEVKEFMGRSIKSVWALELLLFMRRNDRQSWSVDALTAELRSSTFVIANVLASFRQAGLVTEEPDGTFRYAPAASHIDRAVEQIATAHATKPLAVSREILAAGNDKIRSFADAFRLKKD